MTENVIFEESELYRWEGPKRRPSIYSGFTGRLVLTEQRLLFLSTGGHRLTGESRHLSWSALDQVGSIAVPLEALHSFELKGIFKYLSIAYRESDGNQHASAFSPQRGWLRTRWIEAIQEAREDTPR